ncbi:hypothetical protein GCM10009067_41230 [Haloarcula sebkhae]|uniref:Uncharacterized protein n=1 Tax=Haloarcula sebkhae TaxID=932660 RepID=A0A830EXD8_9EURY|nr:hypothetical protein GCM10009067_41230 [Haloarcula sebkhae]
MVATFLERLDPGEAQAVAVAETVDGTVITDDGDARTNVYTLTDAGTRLLQRQADTLADLCDRPVPSLTEVRSNVSTANTATSKSDGIPGHSRSMLSEAHGHWVGDHRLVPYGNNYSLCT